MSTVTPKLGLVKPTTLEQYALSVLNNNMDIIDAAAMQVDETTSSANLAIDFRGCRFTRVRTGTKGIVVVEMVITFGSVAVPVNTAATTDYANVIPDGYRPLGSTSIPVLSALMSNAGAGQGIAWALRSNGTVGLRSQAAAFTTAAGSQCYSQHVYRWDGIL